MFPFSFEWIWDAGHLVFHGGLWYALTILGLGMTYCIIKAALDAAKGNGSRSPLIPKSINAKKRLTHHNRGALFCV